MNIDSAYKEWVEKLSGDYSTRESRQIADLIFEKVTGYSPTIRIIKKRENLAESQIIQLEQCIKKMLRGQPVQYVLEEAWFYGLCFFVNPSVLIPRPETEELVEWMLLKIRKTQKKQRVLDVGTGSGCIPIALKKNNSELEVWGMDKYVEATKVAQKNAGMLKVDAHFLELDLFDIPSQEVLPEFDIIVSNPPYIPQKEEAGMDRHVVAYEPETALFVPDDDALLFYKGILSLADRKLKKGGMVFVEIHEDLGAEVHELFENALANVWLKKDMSGKDRMLFGEKL